MSVLVVFASAAAIWRPRTPPGSGLISDWLQRRLDRVGGTVFLPRLRGGRCYQSRGLWVSHSNTTIVSNGACLEVVGPGPVRLRSADGDPIPASAAFFISRRSPKAPPPSDIEIRGLNIHVSAAGIDGVDVYADNVRIRDIRVEGQPFDDVYIGGRTNLIAYSHRVTLTGSTLLDAERNAISVTAATNVRISGNTIAGAGDSVGPAADPGDGIDIEPNADYNPIANLQITNNSILGNTHAAIALRLRPPTTASRDANRITITGNLLSGNDPYESSSPITLDQTAANPANPILITNNPTRPTTANTPDHFR